MHEVTAASLPHLKRTSLADLVGLHIYVDGSGKRGDDVAPTWAFVVFIVDEAGNYFLYGHACGEATDEDALSTFIGACKLDSLQPS